MYLIYASKADDPDYTAIYPLSNVNIDIECFICYIWNMKDSSPKTSGGSTLNIRDFPSDLLWQLKTRAAQKRLTLRDYVVRVLQKAAAGSDELKTA